MATAPAGVHSPFSPLGTIRFTRNTMVRYSRKMVSAEHRALIALTSTAACILSPNIVKKRAKSWKTGFPGG